MNGTKRCAQCGREKSSDDFSKSYKNLCKECVACNERLKRSGRLFVKASAFDTHRVEINAPATFTTSLRFTAAVAAMQGLLSSPIDANFNLGKCPDDIAGYAVRCADALIEKLNTDNYELEKH